jgi:CitMHS family citrate-Mg2+:H+ or citrate-Ca2+:H+ symporter
MACVIIMAAAVTNLLPWGGPTARAASALKLDPAELFVPMIPAMSLCAVWVLFVAYLFGRRERLRLASQAEASRELHATLLDSDRKRDQAALRPRRFMLNLALTITLMLLLIRGVLPLPVLFMLAFAVALMLNYPSLAEQKQRLDAHAGNALAVVGLIFAAGIFMGILSGTRMVDAMAASVVGVLPPGVGPYMAPITALLSVPFTFLISNDAFYFGILPVLAQTASAYGIEPAELARASLIGQQIHLLSPLVPSTYLLVGMARIELGDHQRFTLPWALGSCAVMLAGSLLFGIFPLVSR